MQLDLTRFRQPLTHFSRSFSPADVAQEGDSYAIVAPVELDFDIHKDREKFRLAGTVRSELELLCSRCLEPFRMPVHATFDLRYLPATAMATASETAIEEDDLETSYYRDDHIDLNELVREQFYLALPMKPLCVDECRGLCAHCGANLNAGACGCSAAWTDPRLEPLKDLARDRKH